MPASSLLNPLNGVVAVVSRAPSEGTSLTATETNPSRQAAPIDALTAESRAAAPLGESTIGSPPARADLQVVTARSLATAALSTGAVAQVIDKAPVLTPGVLGLVHEHAPVLTSGVVSVVRDAATAVTSALQNLAAPKK